MTAVRPSHAGTVPRREGGEGRASAPTAPPNGRRIVVGLLGNSYWTRRLGDSLTEFTRDMTFRRFYADQESAIRTWPLGRWLGESDLWSCSVLHVIGCPRIWNLWVAARMRRVPAILHWIGSDVSSFLASPRWSKAAGPLLNLLVPRHLAEAPNLRRELRTVGIHARVQPKGMRSFDGVETPPLPDRPCAVAMLRPDRFDFYGGNKVLEMAAAAPDIHWLVLANDGAGLPAMPNVEYLGDVEDIDAVFRRATVLVRLTRHDGLSKMVLEALARGRHVIWSQPLPHCHRARTAAEALPQLRSIVASRHLNLRGSDYVRREFDVETHLRRLCRIYAAVAGAPCDV